LEALLSAVGFGVKKLGYKDLIPWQQQLELTVDTAELESLGIKVSFTDLNSTEITRQHQLELTVLTVCFLDAVAVRFNTLMTLAAGSFRINDLTRIVAVVGSNDLTAMSITYWY